MARDASDEALMGFPVTEWDEGLALKTILGEIQPENELLRLIADRIRAAAELLKLSREDLARIFSRHSVFEGETSPPPGWSRGFIIVETHHLIQGKVGKGALKIVYPEDLLGMGRQFKETASGAVEVLPPPGAKSWANESLAEERVKYVMRELMTGESLSMSFKSQATGAPFSGSEGLVLCAQRAFDADGRYFLKPAIQGDDPQSPEDKELIEFMMNAASEVLTRAGRIAYDLIVHAAETNSTLTAGLQLQLPTNVVEGHLRTLLLAQPDIIIGDEDMSARLQEILHDNDYTPTRCALAKAAARMQMDHAILLPKSRARLRQALAEMPERGAPTPSQYREMVDLFFGTGETQQNEDGLYHHREPILRALSVALSARCLDECSEPQVLSLYLRTLLDNQRVMLESILLKCLPPGASLPMDWFERAKAFSANDERKLGALLPAPHASRERIRERYLAIADILFDLLARLPQDAADPYAKARREFLELSLRAITSVEGATPPVERILFFTLPYTYECATPKLGVVTRKPVDVCGSELRREAMAVGAVMALEILLKKVARKTNPLQGLTVAIEGLGNAGKNVARIMVDKGATIVGVSDTKGALIRPGGFTRDDLRALIAHKNSGRRLDTFPVVAEKQGLPVQGDTGMLFYPNPDMLKRVKADILVLTAIPASIHEKNAADLQVKVICELTGAAVTGPAKRILKQRQVHVLPDNLGSSGGLLVSLSEMLQNSAGQVWDRKLEEYNLYEQLARSYDTTVKVARKYDVDLATGSDILALQRMQELACYREQLELLSRELGKRIQAIRPDGHALILVDNDEDGVASAAILQRIVAVLNPAVADQTDFLNESFRSEHLLDFIQQREAAGAPVRHLFVLDRAFPLSQPGQSIIARLADTCSISVVNNHPLPAQLLGPAKPAKAPAGAVRPKGPTELGVLLISPQTLKSNIPARQFPTAMILREIAHQLITDEPVLRQVDWQAAVGSSLEVSEEPAEEWVLFYSRFNPDKTTEAARAIRTVTRAGGTLSAIHALLGVTRPDQLETNEAWGRFMAEYQTLDERVQVLVEKILLENRRRPFTAHFFTHEEVASPTPIAANELNELDFYHWISEHLSRRGNLAEKPIIAGQIVQDVKGRRYLGVRIRSPKGVELMEAGLPEHFKTGGLPNTAVARIPLDPAISPRQMFENLVDDIWMKTTSPLYFSFSGIPGEL